MVENLDTPEENKNGSPKHNDIVISNLSKIIKISVKVLACLMTVVIILGVLDVALTLFQKISARPYFILDINDILATFGSFMAVLIAIEIFVNVVLYLRDDVLHVKVVMATALMAIARKVIIIDFDKIGPEYLFGIGGLVLAMSIGYWLVNSNGPFGINKKN